MKLALKFCSVVCWCLVLAGCARNRPSGQTQNAASSSGFSPMDARTATGPAALTGVPIKNELTADLLEPGKMPFTLGPGDVIEIEIIGNADSRALTAVGLDGKIYFSLLPGLDVWGLTLDQTRELIEKELTKYISQAQVSLNLRIVGSKHVWVLGRLSRPGIYPLTGSMTLLESLAVAGGTARPPSQATSQELADLRHSFVVRQGQFLPVDFQRLLALVGKALVPNN